MIKIENGRTECNGTGAQLCFELSIITNFIRKAVSESVGEEFADKKIREAFENSKLSKDEIYKKYIEEKVCSEKTLFELFETLFKH